MVVDTSVILAIFFKEQHSDWAVAQLNSNARSLRMSTINLTEVLIRLQDRQPQLFSSLEDQFLYGGIRFVAPDIEQSRIAAKARMKYSINLGDCFAYALAKQEDCPIITLDKDFLVLDQTIVHPF
jgi:ribonuclease VapC